MVFVRLVWLVTAAVRLAVVVSPFIYFYLHKALPPIAVPSSIPDAVMLPVYSALAFFLLFWRELAGERASHRKWLAQLPVEEREAYFRRMQAEEEEVEKHSADDPMKAYIPGTVEYYVAGNDRADGSHP